MAAPSPSVQAVAPRIIPLPTFADSDAIGETQWTTLMAIMDAAVPSLGIQDSSSLLPQSQLQNQAAITKDEYDHAVALIQKSTTVDEVLLKAFLDERPSDIPMFMEMLKRTLLCYVREKERGELGNLLVMLNNRIASLLLTGYRSPIHTLPLADRTKILHSWRTSYIPSLNSAFKTFTSLGKNLYIKTSPTFHAMIGFPRHPTPYSSGPHHVYNFLQLPPASTSNENEPEILEIDVVIIGSGCGGGVCAANLSQAGLKVMVLDKGYYHPPPTLPMNEIDGPIHLFDNGGVITVDDGSINIVAGSTWGGGGTINWSASLQPQFGVRREWAVDRKLPFFQGARFQASLDRVCKRMGVGDKQIRHNHANACLMEGSRRLGMTCKPVPQNTGGNEHYCGHCSLGCALGKGGKQGPATTWLVDAAEAGATFMEGLQVEKILFEAVEGKQTAVGVKGVWKGRDEHGGVAGKGTTRNVIVKAKRVILSAGTLWSPIVLLNSGLTNPQIGKNLYLHPVNFVYAIFDEDLKPWEGGILTSVNTSLENLDNHFHGVKLETTAMIPSFTIPSMNWTSGADFKLNALKFRHMNGFISIARDRDTGRIYRDPTEGVPRIEYTPSKFDRAHVLQGVLALCKIALASGAREIMPAIDGIEPYVSTRPIDGEATDDELISEGFQEFLKTVERVGNAPPTASFACAHQMGSNRMSATQKEGVVDAQGKVWGTEGLYISDASVFPSASGVNPMITNMGISDWISRGLVKEMAGVGQKARL